MFVIQNLMFEKLIFETKGIVNEGQHGAIKIGGYY